MIQHANLPTEFADRCNAWERGSVPFLSEPAVWVSAPTLESMFRDINKHFVDLLNLDLDIRAVAHRLPSSIEWFSQWESLAAQYIQTFLQAGELLLSKFTKMEAEWPDVAFDRSQVDQLQENVREARGMLMSDREFFGPELASLEKHAIDDFEQGRCEPL